MKLEPGFGVIVTGIPLEFGHAPAVVYVTVYVFIEFKLKSILQLNLK